MNSPDPALHHGEPCLRPQRLHSLLDSLSQITQPTHSYSDLPGPRVCPPPLSIAKMNGVARSLLSAARLRSSSSSLSSSSPSATATATKRHFEHKILRTDPTHLLSIITDVESYSQFLPLCTSSSILRSSKCGTMFDATLTVGLPPLLTEHYVSRVKVDREEGGAMIVEATSIRSERFDSLRSRWRLRPILADATKGGESSDNNNSYRMAGKEVTSGGSDDADTADTANCSLQYEQRRSSNTDHDINATFSEEKEESSSWWCDVQFEVEMTVSDPIIVGALDTVLEEVAGRQVAAFERRCFQIRPQSSGSTLDSFR